MAIVEPLLSYGNLMAFQNGGGPPSWILTNVIFDNCEYSSEAQCASSCKTLWQPFKMLLRYGNFSIS